LQVQVLPGVPRLLLGFFGVFHGSSPFVQNSPNAD